ncbi:hypothetical protein [Nocardioides hungaricus]
MATGLIGISASPSAADCPYTGCVATATNIFVRDTVKRGNRAKICVAANTGGNGRPKGRVNIRVERSKGGFKFVDSKPYNDNRECFRTGKLNKLGKYVVRATFEARPGSVFRDSDNNTSFRVIRR